MTAQHTPGRLVVGDAGADQQRLVIDAKDYWANGLFLSNGTFDPEDARRLAACWNACEGLSTDDLEVAGVVSKGEMMDSLRERDTLRDDARAIEANYEAARALLSEVDRMDDACGIATGPGEAFTTYEFQALMGKVAAFLKGGAT